MVFVAYMIILPMPRCGGVASPGVHKVFILLFIYYYYYYFLSPPCPFSPEFVSRTHCYYM